MTDHPRTAIIFGAASGYPQPGCDDVPIYLSLQEEKYEYLDMVPFRMNHTELYTCPEVKRILKNVRKNTPYKKVTSTDLQLVYCVMHKG